MVQPEQDHDTRAKTGVRTGQTKEDSGIERAVRVCTGMLTVEAVSGGKEVQYAQFVVGVGYVSALTAAPFARLFRMPYVGYSVSGASGRKSFREVKHYRRRKHWLS